jgi:hypothetical protein
MNQNRLQSIQKTYPSDHLFEKLLGLVELSALEWTTDKNAHICFESVEREIL